ncbi:MAG TPA: efflux RND transporter periplasmic adaptor subunit [Opitutaceae bacterium]|nr:efflux RND transporter periplasmic adaptor subunit [Opitutaceae bacterium]
MFKKLAITIVGLVVLVGVLGGIKGLQFQTMLAAGAAMQPPPEPVTTAVVTAEAWAPTIEAIGSLTAVQGVTVAAELDGKIVQIAFEPGSVVKAGDLLVKQDTSTEEAQLRSAEASVALARINLERDRELQAQATIAQSELDAADAQFKQAAAQADNIRATIAKKTIRAPFSGRLGIRLVNLGQSLKSGDAIVSLQALDPIYVNFLLPQQRLSQLARDLVVRVTSDAAPGQVKEGKITAINPDVDSATRNVRVQATLGNSDEQLHPGMFVNVSVVLPSVDQVLVIPATAVLYAPYGNSVFVVEEKKNDHGGQAAEVLRQQLVRLGARRGDFVAVASGLKAGETVVTSGVFKLRNGIAVTVNNSLAPDAQLAPHPNDT